MVDKTNDNMCMNNSNKSGDNAITEQEEMVDKTNDNMFMNNSNKSGDNAITEQEEMVDKTNDNMFMNNSNKSGDNAITEQEEMVDKTNDNPRGKKYIRTSNGLYFYRHLNEVMAKKLDSNDKKFLFNIGNYKVFDDGEEVFLVIIKSGKKFLQTDGKYITLKSNGVEPDINYRHSDERFFKHTRDETGNNSFIQSYKYKGIYVSCSGSEIVMKDMRNEDYDQIDGRFSDICFQFYTKPKFDVVESQQKRGCCHVM